MKQYSELQPHQQRVVHELEALTEKIQKLDFFMTHPKFNEVDVAEQERMRRQIGHMRAYGAVLEERIAAF